MVYYVVGTVGGPSKNKRGPVINKHLEDHVKRHGKIELRAGADGLPENADVGNKYVRAVGPLIKSKCPMLWGRWKDVPQEVRNLLDNDIGVS